jgi:hypothetical protein
MIEGTIARNETAETKAVLAIIAAARIRDITFIARAANVDLGLL